MVMLHTLNKKGLKVIFSIPFWRREAVCPSSDNVSASVGCVREVDIRFFCLADLLKVAMLPFMVLIQIHDDC